MARVGSAITYNGYAVQGFGTQVFEQDLTGDGVIDAVAQGPSGSPGVVIMTTQPGQEANRVRVAAGDLDGDGRADIITGSNPWVEFRHATYLNNVWGFANLRLGYSTTGADGFSNVTDFGGSGQLIRVFQGGVLKGSVTAGNIADFALQSAADGLDPNTNVMFGKGWEGIAKGNTNIDDFGAELFLQSVTLPGLGPITLDPNLPTNLVFSPIYGPGTTQPDTYKVLGMNVTFNGITTGIVNPLLAPAKLAVPEPTTLALGAFGLVALVWTAGKRKSR